jgi:hypothetical protein
VRGKKIKKPVLLTKYDRLNHLLGEFGKGNYSHEFFWSRMSAYGYTQADIDEWCAEYHKRSKEHETAKQQGTKQTWPEGAGDA